MPMTLWRRRRGEDLRPTWEQRQAALESVRSQLRRQGASARRRALVRRLTPAAMLVAFAAGVLAAGPLLRVAVAALPSAFGVRHLALLGADRLDAAEIGRLVARRGEPGSAPRTADDWAHRIGRHPWVSEVRTVRVAPDTVVVRIVERVPAAIWVRGPGESFLIDAAGTPFASAEAEPLPRLYLDAANAPVCQPAQDCTPDARLVAGVALARAVEDAGFARPQIELDGPDPLALPILHLAGVAPRVLLGRRELETQLAHLARVLAVVPASRDAREIDLRFAGQVVLRPALPAPGESHEAPAEEHPPTSGTERRAG
jgi:hypothetical protein